MQENSLERWELEFQKAAEADSLVLCRDHLHRLGLPEEPELLVHAKVLAVQACCAYASIDGQSLAGFLQLQKCRPADVPDAKYAFTCDLLGKGFARMLVSAKLGVLDLADLYGLPWWEYELCGYRCTPPRGPDDGPPGSNVPISKCNLPGFAEVNTIPINNDLPTGAWMGLILLCGIAGYGFVRRLIRAH